MKRRDFITGLGMAAALPGISHAQEATPTVGFLSTRSPAEAAIHTDVFRRGLEGMGYVEGRNIAIEYRWRKVTTANYRHLRPTCSRGLCR